MRKSYEDYRMNVKMAGMKMRKIARSYDAAHEALTS